MTGQGTSPLHSTLTSSRIFAMHNSGTYNNQWMVVDYKLFTPGMTYSLTWLVSCDSHVISLGQALKPGTLWIAEQIPGLVERADKTSTVTQTGYWASYNIPYFVNIYNMSGYPPYEQKYGDMWSYSNCARAKIFRRSVKPIPPLSDETDRVVLEINIQSKIWTQ